MFLSLIPSTRTRPSYHETESKWAGVCQIARQLPSQLSQIEMRRVVVLLSGAGSTLLNIFDCIDQKTLDAEVVLVVASKKSAKGLDHARGTSDAHTPESCCVLPLTACTQLSRAARRTLLR